MHAPGKKKTMETMDTMGTMDGPAPATLQTSTVYYLPLKRKGGRFCSKQFPRAVVQEGMVVRGHGLRVWAEVSSLMLCTSVSIDCPETGVALVVPTAATSTENNVIWETVQVLVVEVLPATADNLKALAKASQVICTFDESWGMDCRYWPCRRGSDLPCRVFGSGYPRCGKGLAFEWERDKGCDSDVCRALVNNGRFGHDLWFTDGSHQSVSMCGTEEPRDC